MQDCQISQTAQIYLDQIKNYVQKGEGYQQIRTHLLKQLNQIDCENANSDDTLVGALIEMLRKKIMNDSWQNVSRTLDVLEDLIKYADQTVQYFICQQIFCITLSTAVAYKSLNLFNRSNIEQNKLRMSSIVLYYYNKFQSDPPRYMHVFKAYRQFWFNMMKYRQLKEKNCPFPANTYIVVPKQNQFRKGLEVKKKVSQSGSSSESDRIGVTFQSIVEFIRQCEIQYNRNKYSCANTQFVRALKIKAKTLFDLSQNTQGLTLNPKQKQQAKTLYKQIRTMLKQIQKLNEEKIKQQKIKSQKQFAQEKIQQITPNKKSSGVSGNTIQSSKSLKQTSNGKDLLGDNENHTINKNINPSAQQIRTPIKIKNQGSLLDMDEQNKQNTIEKKLEDKDQDDEFVFASPAKSHHSEQSSGQKGKQFKGLKPPPKYQSPIKGGNVIKNVEEIDILGIQNNQIKVKEKQSIKQEGQLIDVGQAPKQVFVKKPSIKHQNNIRNSINSQQSDTKIKSSPQSQGNVSQKKSNKNTNQIQNTDKSILDFNNQQHYSKFDLINQLIDPNTYNVIPHDIDFSDSSSSHTKSQNQNNRVVFKMANNDNQIYQEENLGNKGYDPTFRTPKKQASQFQNVGNHGGEENNEGVKKLSLSAKIIKGKQVPQPLLPNYNFGVLADCRQVKAYDYKTFQHQNSGQRSSFGDKSQQQQKGLRLTPHSKKGQSSSQLSPSQLNFNNNSSDKKNGNKLLEQKDEDQQFEDYQKVKTPVKQENRSLVSELGSISFTTQQPPQILKQKSAQKQSFINSEQMASQNNEPLL